RGRVVSAVSVLGALAMSAIVATRATLLGIVAALIAAATIRRPTGRALIVGTVATAAVGVALAMTPLGQRVIGGASVNDRFALWDVALRATLARPLLGYGPDNFRAAFAAHRTIGSIPLLGVGPQATAHNWILDASDAEQRNADRKSTRLNSSHLAISHAAFCLNKKAAAWRQP